MTFEEIKALDEQYVMQTYARFPVALDHGQGSTLWDVNGKEYIDFTAGIAVSALGYNHPQWVQAINDQATKLGHVSNLFYTEPYAKAAQKLCEGAGMSNVFFANSGAEANEGMIKVARKYSSDKYGKGRGTIITLNKSFHGRTMATLAATGQDHYHTHFYPFPDGFRYADANDISSVEAVAGHDVCAVMMELIQGEGGLNPLDVAFVQKVADLCAKRDWLLLIDEVQTGVGRTGSLFAFQQFGIQPDVISFAKGVAGGLPFGGVMANEKCRDVMGSGTHGATFGANPVAAAAACVVLDLMDEEMLQSVKIKGNYLREQIEAMDLPCFGKTCGMGLMIGVDVKGDMTNSQIAAKLIDNGLLVLTAGTRLRLLPPLVITKEEMDKGLAIMKAVLG